MNNLFALDTLLFRKEAKEGPLYPLYEELDRQNEYFLRRKREVSELIELLALRCKAEQEYSQRLILISESAQGIKIGTLGKEIDAFKADCGSKGMAAQELAENARQDCLVPL